ncbi:MAG TPA: hypothetical protein PL180_19385, partial [Spirochaetota bacterium]|nr:hypothetical protein [Spirochaetota bacterium]
MDKQKDIHKILEEDGYGVINKPVLPEKSLEQISLQESDRAKDYLNFLKKKSDRDRSAAPGVPT